MFVALTRLPVWPMVSVEKSDRRLRIGTDLVPTPSGRIHTSFVEETWRKSMVPEGGVGVIDLLVMEEVVLAGRAVQGSCRLRNPVNGKGDAIGGVEIGIGAAIVLSLGESIVAGGDVVSNVGDAVKAAPTPGFEVLVQPRSCVPSPVFKGEPISKPWPGMVRQSTFSVRPASAQVEGLILVLLTPAPGKLRYVAAMLPAGADLSKAGVSYHPLAMLG